ncbi:unnamed protein product [Bursaphelenchus okinawaensis]|uniref:Uncharacterized protein n=1 Tax=Bursaphelenchus okinawaensis TaxID=465554 RepID=A0A811KRF6_9BILA|nr:unnamed protein product [Bursaphelenchus okinawaensis]CAG9111581.1 unnamed protein product [Bursaphelenchus okinawaensis]
MTWTFICLLTEIVYCSIVLAAFILCCNHSNKLVKNKTRAKSKSKSSPMKSGHQKKKNKSTKSKKVPTKSTVTKPTKVEDVDRNLDKTQSVEDEEENKQSASKDDKQGSGTPVSKKSNNESKPQDKPKSSRKKTATDPAPAKDKSSDPDDPDDVVIKEDKVKKMGVLDEEVRKRQQKDQKEIQDMGSEHALDKDSVALPDGAKVAIKVEHCKLYETEHEGTLDE